MNQGLKETQEIAVEYQVARYAAEARILRGALNDLVTQIKSGVKIRPVDVDITMGSMIMAATAHTLHDLRKEGQVVERDGIDGVVGTSSEGIDIGLMGSFVTRVGNHLAVNTVLRGGKV
jgi:hypothetical protein